MIAKRLGYVDSLRCLAAMAVLAQHLLERIDSAAFGSFLNCAPGVFGVVLFFYVSGFVIPLSVQKAPALGRFVIRRVFRIYPAYLAALVVLAVGAFVTHQPSPFKSIGLFGALMNGLLLHEFVRIPAILGVTWTLSLELAWYVVFALSFFRARPTRVSRLLVAYSCGMLAASVVSCASGLRLPAGRLGLIGAALAGYLAWQRAESRVSRSEYLGAVSLFVVAMGVSLYVSFGIFAHPDIRLHQSVVPWALATLIFFGVTAPRAVRLQQMIALSWVVFLGEISYSIYLLHGPIISWLIEVSSPTLSLFLAPCASVACAWLFHRYVELPGIRLGKRAESLLAARESISSASG